VNGETGSFVEPSSVRAFGPGPGRHLGRENRMSNIRSTTARRCAATLALAVGLALTVAVPASAATHGGLSSKHNRSGHAATGSTGGVALGPAVKYVRHADGSIHRVR
jgi:hypothetical protein